ncbi:MAG: ATP-binding protein [Spirochaetales bacterium]|nr:ATP-binding protein [Spirochaetales bacterium]
MEIALRFFGRRDELNILEGIYNQCCESYGKITVITGRRRIGKTVLSQKYAENKDNIYLFINKKEEKLLCDEFIILYEELTKKKFIGKIEYFYELFELLMEYGENHPFVLIIDEFQEFININKSTYSEIQRIWDKYKFKTKAHVIFIGSIYSLMKEIFQNEKEPLYGRADRVLYLKPFKISTLKEVLIENNSYNEKNLFTNYLITGGVPRYLEILNEAKKYNEKEIIDFIFQKDSFFLEEGRNLLVQEFGKEYGKYFTILELISVGRTSRSEIESVIGKSVGGFLDRLENEYDVIERIRPIGSKKDSRNQKYVIKDNFIEFWFRFVNKNMSMIYADRFDYIKRIIERDLPTFSGPKLEKLFTEIIGYNPEYGLIGRYWEKGNLNEIDIVALNDLDKKIYFAEVKLNKDKININKLKGKTVNLLQKYKGYKVQYEALSIEDIDRKLKEIYI